MKTPFAFIPHIISFQPLSMKKFVYILPVVVLICLKSASAISASEENKNNAKTNHLCDTALVNRNLRIIDTLRYSNIPKALEYTDTVLKISTNCKYQYGLAEGYFYLGTLYLMTDQWDDGKSFLDKSVSISKRECLKTTLSKCYINLTIYFKSIGNYDSAFFYASNIEKDTSLVIPIVKKLRNTTNLADMYIQKGNYPDAILLLKKGATIAEKNNVLDELAKIYALLGRCYAYADKSLAISFEKKSLKIIHDNKYEQLMPLLLNFLCLIYIENNQIDSTLFYSLESLKYLKYMGASDQLTTYINLSQTYATLNNTPKAVEFHNKGKDLLEYADSRIRLAYAINEANVLIITGKGKNAIGLLNSAEAKAIELAEIELQRLVYQSFIELYQRLHDASNELKYHKLLKKTEDAINSKRNKEILSIFRVEYEVELKNKEIETLTVKTELQQSIIQKNRLLSMLLLTSLLFIVVISSLYILYLNRKKKNAELILRKNEEIANQKFKNLFKDSQLTAIREKIAGQEEERRRIARELHDGIGGTLTAVRMRLEGAGLKPSPEDIASLSNLITSTWEEVRAISHNLTPPQFSDVSIDQVLQNHIRELNKSEKTRFSIQCLPDSGWEDIPVEIQVEVYRIVQELCANITKYSDATRVELQLALIDHELSLTLEDNGAPFDYTPGGIGYRNIVDRLQLLNGHYEKSSSKGRGNTHMVVIPIPETIYACHE
jgi:signal transduction histidine kinase